MNFSLSDWVSNIKDKLLFSQWYDGEYVSEGSPIIIGGSPRSGTTLLRVMLDSHSNIYCGPESNLFLQPRVKTKKVIKGLSWRFDVSINKIELLLKSSECLAEFIERFFNELCFDHGKKRWGEKTPRNVLNIGYIFKHFPKSKFIHVIRDGRDVVCSLRKLPGRKYVNGGFVMFDIERPFDECVTRWVNHIIAGKIFFNDPRYHEILYEDLCKHPKNTLKKLCKFIDEPYDVQMLRYYESNHLPKSRDDNMYYHVAGTKKSVYIKSIERWRKEFTKDEKIQFKKLGGDLLIQFGYEKNNDW